MYDLQDRHGRLGTRKSIWGALLKGARVCLYAGIGKIDAGQRASARFTIQGVPVCETGAGSEALAFHMRVAAAIDCGEFNTGGSRMSSPESELHQVRKPSLSRRVDIQVLVLMCTAYTTWTETCVFGVEGRAACSLAAAYRARVWIVLTMFCVHRIRHQFISIYACHGIRVS